ncbi:MAG: non-ribosomal peptide synthetase [Candidatus Aminicenantes bacterium]|nr:MAG: non-ribosomal peptide synthetase [Candidatus Aminicenantes bacterium]
MSERNYDKLAAAADQNVKEKDFWLAELAGDLVKTGFPYDHKNKINHLETHCLPLCFPQDQSSWLMQLSKGSDVKLHMILTAILVLLLNKYTGHNDIIIGAPIYKQEADIDFINTVLMLRHQIHEYMTFKELLLQVKEKITRTAEHQNYPVEILLEQLNIPYETRANDFPLFDIAIMHENIHYKRYLQYIPYHLLFSFKRTDEQVEGVLEYHPGLYRESTIKQTISHYNRLLSQVLFNPDMLLSNCEILSEEEKQRILIDFNNTSAGYPGDKTLHECFARQVENTPDHIALVSEELLQDFQLTYRELNQRANQLAHFLRNRGVKPDHVVALMVEKSLEMMVGILGILKTGAAYLPIELAYPSSRIEYMLNESGANVLLTYGQNPLSAKVTGTPVLAREIIDIFSPGIYKTGCPGLNGIGAPVNAAYIIYTSGSTGRPKGVIVEHRNVMAYLQAFDNEFEISVRDTALQQASYSFDAFVEEVYPLLFKGGKVAICPRYVLLDSQVLERFILKHDITFISVSPLLLNEINQLPGTGSIRIFISGGDELKKEYITNLLERGSVYNTYGPTEAAVCATYQRCSPEDNANLSIGKPIANYRVFILDSHCRLVPIGVPGELCIAGPGVTRGYLNRPELTAERFLEGTRGLAPLPDYSTIYRSGDKARWFPDGSIEFLGRIDKQVKIRGFRIELGEIENQLLQHEDISAALVLVKDINKNKTGGSHGEQRQLCAYIAARQELSVPGLREYLLKHLPDYMVPSYYVLLERMPLTPNGKPALNVLEGYEPIPGTGAEYIAPANDTEITIAEIWKELLHLDKVSIHDNFFDLGGNSMLLLKATNKLREAFKFKGDIPFTVMFQYTTIHSLYEYLNQAEVESIDSNKKYNQQAETLNKGKNRMKKFIRQAKEANDE